MGMENVIEKIGVLVCRCRPPLNSELKIIIENEVRPDYRFLRKISDKRRDELSFGEKNVLQILHKIYSNDEKSALYNHARKSLRNEYDRIRFGIFSYLNMHHGQITS